METDSTEQMKLATFLARTGEPDRARFVFSRVVEEDPANFQAWLWLSELSNDLEEQTAYLEQAQKYAPRDADGCADLQAYLMELRGCIMLGAPALPAPEISLLEEPDQIAGQPLAMTEPEEAQWRAILLNTDADPGAVLRAKKRGSPVLDFARSLFNRLF